MFKIQKTQEGVENFNETQIKKRNTGHNCSKNGK